LGGVKGDYYDGIIFYGTATPPTKGGEIAHDGTNP